MNPFRPSLFSSVPGVRCCDCPGCLFTLPPPIGGSPYADSTAATDAINDQTASCISYVELGGGGTLTAFTATSGTNTISTFAEGNPDGAPSCQATVWFAGSFSASGTISITLTIGSFFDGSCVLYDDTGSSVDTDSGSASMSLAVPSDGNYEVKIVGVSSVPGFGGGSDTFTFDSSFDSTMTICTIRAAYDDGMGGTAYITCVP